MMTLLAACAILFILYVTLFIGFRVGKRVQDEIVPSRKYLEMAIDVLLLLALGISIFSFGQRWLAIVVPLALIILRAFFPFTYAYAPLSGIVLGFSTLLAGDIQVVVVTLCLVMNFLLGATARKPRALLLQTLAQPVMALLALLVIALLL